MINPTQSTRDDILKRIEAILGKVSSSLELTEAVTNLVNLPGKYELTKSAFIREYPLLIQMTYPQSYELHQLPIPEVERLLIDSLAPNMSDFTDYLLEGKVSYNEGWVMEYLLTVIIHTKGYVT